MAPPEVRPYAEFSEEPDHPLGFQGPFLHLLAQVTDTGRVADNFRVAVSSLGSITFHFKGSELFTHAQFGCFDFSYTVRPAGLNFAWNRLATEWVNVNELVSAGMMQSLREDEGDAFLDVWDRHVKDAAHPAAAIRFVVVMNDDFEFDLMLEGLPADAGRLLGLPVLRKDDSAAIRLGAAGLAHTRDAEAGVASVRPQLFSHSPGEARDSIAARPKDYYAGIRRVWHRFFIPETLGQRDAAALVRTPREGNCHRPLGREETRMEREEPVPSASHSPASHMGKSRPCAVTKKFRNDRLDRLAWLQGEGPADPNIRARVSAGLSEKTWGRHATVWRALMSFAGERRSGLSWPLDEKTILDFASWCDKRRRLSAGTIKTYINSLSKIQQMKGGPPICVKKVPFLTDFLAGVRHEPRKKAERVKLVVSFPLLQVMGHWTGIETDWSQFEKIRFWAVCLASFFGSLRIGELLSETSKNFDPEKTLLWKDIKISDDDTVRLRIRSPKVENPGGDLIVLFRFPVKGMCPVEAFKVYKAAAEERGLTDKNLPVFRSGTGGAWPKRAFQKQLEKIVGRTGLVKGKGKIVCHSFRGGIPSALAAQLSPEAAAATQEWGRWRSQAYIGYTRHHISLRREIFA